MNYFEKMQKRHREETASLKAEVSALRQSESGLRDRCGDQADTIAELTRDLQEARESAGRMEQELTALRKKAEELQRELSSQKALGTELLFQGIWQTEQIDKFCSKHVPSLVRDGCLDHILSFAKKALAQQVWDDAAGKAQSEPGK